MRRPFRQRRRVVYLVVAAVAATLTACGPTASRPAASPTAGTTSAPVPTPATTPAPPRPSPSVPAPTTTAPTTTTATPTAAVPAARPTPTGPRLLRIGDRGADVLALQERLRASGYWLATPDGVFGGLTQQAVYAVQKAAGLSRDGIVGPRTMQALAQGVRPSVRKFSGHTIQIDLPRQLLVLTTNGRIDWILNTSTGGGYTYWDAGESHRAITPTGSFSISWQVDGWDRSPLGMLWRPKYFVGGIAVHGYDSVPPYPASHGCVRVSISAMDWIWATGQAPIGTRVVVY